jgi:hypothetical protein
MKLHTLNTMSSLNIYNFAHSNMTGILQKSILPTGQVCVGK